MAELNGYDANKHEPLNDFGVIPKGDYLAIATNSSMKPTKAGTGFYLEIEWEILEGEHKGRKLWSRLNLDNPNPTAVQIANRELSSICRAVGVMKPKDSEELHNKSIVLKVVVAKRRDNGEPESRIKGYEAAGSSVPSPQPPPEPGASPAPLPWMV